MPGLAEPEQLLPQIAQKYLGTLPYIAFVGAIVSAILSTVASALLAAAAIAQHNLIVPLRPSLSPAARVRVARGCVIVAGVVAYVLARHTESVYGLVEQASAFGSAGFFTVGVIGLFTRFGNARAAYAALIAGSGAWLLGRYALDLPYAYLTSLAAALVAYALGALSERQARSMRVASSS
jgi:Na+/proline symporter